MTLPLSPRQATRYIELMMSSLKLMNTWAAIKDFRDYYAGDQPVFLSPRQTEYLGALLTQSQHPFCFNVCRPVIDTLRERIRIKGISGRDAAGELLATRLTEFWNAGNMAETEITVHRRALRDGKAYITVGWDDELRMPTWTADALFDGDQGVTFHRDPETDKPMLAIKYWTVANPLDKDWGEKRRTVYFPDRIMRYREDPAGEYGWSSLRPEEKPVQWWTDTFAEGGKPLGLACTELRNPGGKGELVNLVGLQNAINKALLDILAAMDATGFQILTITYPGPETGSDEAADESDAEEDTSDDLKIAPGRAIELFDGATASRIEAGNLDPLLAGFRALLGTIAAESRTPQYYLWPVGGSDVPSGEALKQLESGLVAKAQERVELFTAAWLAALRVGARLWTAMTGNVLDAAAPLELTWRSVEVRNEFTDASIAKLHRELEVPVKVLWQRRLGYSAQDVEDFERQRAAEQAEAILNAALASNNGTTSNTSTGQPRQPVAAAAGV